MQIFLGKSTSRGRTCRFHKYYKASFGALFLCVKAAGNCQRTAADYTRRRGFLLSHCTYRGSVVLRVVQIPLPRTISGVTMTIGTATTAPVGGNPATAYNLRSAPIGALFYCRKSGIYRLSSCGGRLKHAL